MTCFRNLILLGLAAMAIAAACATAPAEAQIRVDMDVRGYLCREPADARDFQYLASTQPQMPRAAALWRFNRTREKPRCRWYETTHLIYKGALQKERRGDQPRTRYLFVGGDGGVFEVLVYETPEGTEKLYSWRRTAENAG